MSTAMPVQSQNELPDIRDALPLGPGDEALMGDLHEVLKKHSALKRFGITLLHKHFDLAPDEVLVENAHRVDRTLLVKPAKASEFEGVKSIETSWRLDSGKPVMNCKCIDSGGDHSHQSRG
jgi:hypothetical protein